MKKLFKVIGALLLLGLIGMHVQVIHGMQRGLGIFRHLWGIPVWKAVTQSLCANCR